jgi:hypothetical protein
MASATTMHPVGALMAHDGGAWTMCRVGHQPATAASRRAMKHNHTRKR